MPNLSIDAQTRYDYIERLLRADHPPPAKIVEFGSAPGDQIASLARHGYQATSVDIGDSADAWGSGEEGRMTHLLADAGVENITWNLELIPYPLPDGTFDAVIMTEVFEHLRDYPIRSLQEASRILRPGGRLYLTTPNTAYLMTRLRALAGRSTGSSLQDWIGGVPHARHAREYTFSEMDELLRRAGLQVRVRQSRHFHIDAGRGGAARLVKRVLGLMARLRPTLGPQIVVVAQKPTA